MVEDSDLNINTLVSNFKIYNITKLEIQRIIKFIYQKLNYRLLNDICNDSYTDDKLNNGGLFYEANTNILIET